MHLEALAIRAFRNLAPVTLSLGGGVNFFYGANGQGKTNLLEACALLTNGVSPRTSVLAETIPWASEGADLSAREEAYGVTYRVTMVIRAKGRTISVDGVPRRTVPGLPKGCLALTFLPEDLEILTGEPSLRRAFLDQTLALIEPAHATDLRAYQGALLSRTRILKDAGTSFRGALDQLLTPYEGVLIERGAAIARRRALLCADLATELRHAAEEFALPLAIGATYVPHLPELLDPTPEGQAAALAKLVARREVDLLQKRTTVGPHRDDLLVECKGAGVRTFASRGETRLAMVLLLIAKLRVVMARLGLTPLIILDDIFSELDRERRQLVIAALPAGAQVLCSAVERDLHADWLRGLEGVKTFQVSNGVVTEREMS